MKIQTNGKDQIAGGRIFHPDEKGFVDIPDDIAKAEGLSKSEKPSKAVDEELQAMIEEAIKLGLTNSEGNKMTPSALGHLGKEGLAEAIAKFKILNPPSGPAGGPGSQQ